MWNTHCRLPLQNYNLCHLHLKKIYFWQRIYAVSNGVFIIFIKNIIKNTVKNEIFIIRQASILLALLTFSILRLHFHGKTPKGIRGSGTPRFAWCGRHSRHFPLLRCFAPCPKTVRRTLYGCHHHKLHLWKIKKCQPKINKKNILILFWQPWSGYTRPQKRTACKTHI